MLSPGISLSKLLRLAPDSTIKFLLTSDQLELLSLVDQNLLSGQRLHETAANLLSVEPLLKTDQKRAAIFKLLSKDKRKEFAIRIGLGIDASFEELVSIGGLVSKKRDVLAFFGVAVGLTKTCELPPAEIRITPEYGLFDYQRVLLDKAWEKIESGPKTVVLHLPTGGGKTRTAMHLIAKHLKKYSPTIIIWIAHSRELLEQAAIEFEKCWNFLGNREVGLVRMWGDFDSDPLAIKDGIIVAGIQKLSFFKHYNINNFLKLADRAKLTIIDETHIAAAPTYKELIKFLWSKRTDNRLLGLTATPGRSWSDISKDKELSEIFYGEKVMLEVEGYSNPVTYLIQKGYLAEPKFKLLNSEAGLMLSTEEKKALIERYEISENLLERLGEIPTRNLKIVSAIEDLATRHRRILVFAPSVASAKVISTVLTALKLNSHCVTSETSSAERKRSIELFKGSRLETIILCNYGVLTTGFDAPKTSAAVIARPTLSLVLYSQMVGRAIRGLKAGGNKEAEIVTVVDPELPGFGKIEDAFRNWEDVWNE